MRKTFGLLCLYKIRSDPTLSTTLRVDTLPIAITRSLHLFVKMPAWNTGNAKLLERQDPMAGPPVFPPGYLEFNNKDQILSITSAFFAVAMFTVLIRCYVRVAMLKVFGIDDYIMVFAMVCSTGAG